MRVGVCRIEFFLHENHSLKGKRQVLARIKEKTFRKFGIPVVEVEHQDLWQRAALGFSVVGGEEGKLRELIAAMIRFMEGLTEAEVTRQESEILEV